MESIKPIAVRYMHLRRAQVKAMHDLTHVHSYMDYCPYGGVTVAYRDMGDGDVQVALGRCRPDERYERKMGRVAAAHNLLTNGDILHVPEGKDKRDVIMQYAFRKARRNLRTERRVSVGRVKGSLL